MAFETVDQDAEKPGQLVVRPGKSAAGLVGLIGLTFSALVPIACGDSKETTVAAEDRTGSTASPHTGDSNAASMSTEQTEAVAGAPSPTVLDRIEFFSDRRPATEANLPDLAVPAVVGPDNSDLPPLSADPFNVVVDCVNESRMLGVTLPRIGSDQKLVCYAFDEGLLTDEEEDDPFDGEYYSLSILVSPAALDPLAFHIVTAVEEQEVIHIGAARGVNAVGGAFEELPDNPAVGQIRAWIDGGPGRFARITPDRLALEWVNHERRLRFFAFSSMDESEMLQWVNDHWIP